LDNGVVPLSVIYSQDRDSQNWIIRLYCIYTLHTPIIPIKWKPNPCLSLDSMNPSLIM
jgi:hypothetical protein